MQIIEQNIQGNYEILIRWQTKLSYFWELNEIKNICYKFMAKSRSEQEKCPTKRISLKNILKKELLENFTIKCTTKKKILTKYPFKISFSKNIF